MTNSNLAGCSTGRRIGAPKYSVCELSRTPGQTSDLCRVRHQSADGREVASSVDRGHAVPLSGIHDLSPMRVVRGVEGYEQSTNGGGSSIRDCSLGAVRRVGLHNLKSNS